MENTTHTTQTGADSEPAAFDTSFWGEPISVYTRTMGIEDGVLIDVSATAKNIGFRIPVAMTDRFAAELGDRGQLDNQLDMALTYVLWGARNHPDTDRVDVTLPPATLGIPKVSLSFYALIHGGDDREPVMTLMLEDED